MLLTNFSTVRTIARLLIARENDGDIDPATSTPAGDVDGNTPVEVDGAVIAKGDVPQDKVNALLAAERRKARAAAEKMANQLKELRESVNLTAAEREKLEANLEEMRIASMTKEQLAAQKLQEAKAEATNRLKTVEGEVTRWKSHFEEHLITRSILDQAAPVAYNAGQFIPVLRPNARVVEVMGENNTPTGQFEVRVRLTQMKEGKPTTMDLSVAEAVNQLEKDPTWANLFKSNQVAGAGINSAAPTGPLAVTLKGISSEDYRKVRDRVVNGGK